MWPLFHQSIIKIRLEVESFVLYRLLILARCYNKSSASSHLPRKGIRPWEWLSDRLYSCGSITVSDWSWSQYRCGFEFSIVPLPALIEHTRTSFRVVLWSIYSLELRASSSLKPLSDPCSAFHKWLELSRRDYEWLRCWLWVLLVLQGTLSS